jgi:cbb3-type cytochrome oxidase subunit 3
MQRQSGWLFWTSMPNALALAWTLVPYALVLGLLLSTYRTANRRAAAAATAVAAGLLAMTLLLYAGPLVDDDGLLSGPAFIAFPAYVLIIGGPALAVVRWVAGRAQRRPPPNELPQPSSHGERHG